MYKDFANVYDKLMSEADYDEWFMYIDKIIKSLGIKKEQDIMDLGCGTGEMLLRLKRNLYDRILGLDISPDMLLIAKQKIDKEELEIPLVNQDMRDFSLPVAFDLIVCLFDTINHLVSIEELENTLENVYNHLDDGAYFIFDIVTRKFMNEMFENGIFLDDREDLTIMWKHYYDENTELDNVSTTFFARVEDNIYERLEEVYQKKIFTEEEVETSIEKMGFEISKKDKNRNLAGKRIFYVLKKKENNENKD